MADPTDLQLLVQAQQREIALEAEVARLRDTAARNQEVFNDLHARWSSECALSHRLRDSAAQHRVELRRESAAHEQTRAELERWRAAWGEIGPQTPDEVPVFLRESERVQGQVAACEIAKARARVAELESELDETESAGGETQARALAAESALASARTLLDEAETVLECAEPHVAGTSVEGQIDDWKQAYGTWLSANPTPGAEKGAGT